MWSPLEIKILMHSYGCRAPFPEMDREVVKDAHDALEINNLVEEVTSERNETIYVATKRGEAMVWFILCMPTPQDRFVNPQTGEVFNPDQ